MKRILHIRTRPADSCAEAALTLAPPGNEITVLDWSEGEPDYEAALEAIFRADTAQVW